jgi:hypothetical protein
MALVIRLATIELRRALAKHSPGEKFKYARTDEWRDSREPSQFRFRPTQRSGRSLVNRTLPGRVIVGPARNRHRKKPEAFDATAFAERINYTNEVKELGISEEDAKRLCIGFINKNMMKGRVSPPKARAILGYMGWDGKEMKFPSRWLASNVVLLQRGAWPKRWGFFLFVPVSVKQK